MQRRTFLKLFSITAASVVAGCAVNVKRSNAKKPKVHTRKHKRRKHIRKHISKVEGIRIHINSNKADFESKHKMGSFENPYPSLQVALMYPPNEEVREYIIAHDHIEPG